jgi:hypothetical protein
LIADQWSPYNKDGKKKYDRDFLMQLQYDPQSLKKPEDLPKLEVVIDKVSKVDATMNFPWFSMMIHLTYAKLEFLIHID